MLFHTLIITAIVVLLIAVPVVLVIGIVRLVSRQRLASSTLDARSGAAERAKMNSGKDQD